MKLSTLIPGSQEYSGLQSCSSLSFDPTKDLLVPPSSLLNEPALIEEEEETLDLPLEPDIVPLEDSKESDEPSHGTKQKNRGKAKKRHSKRRNPGRHHSHDGTTGSDLFAMFESLKGDEVKPKKDKSKSKSSHKKKDPLESKSSHDTKRSTSKRKTPKRHHSHEATSGSDLFAMFNTLNENEDEESGNTESLSPGSSDEKKKDSLSSVSAHGRKHPRDKPRVPRRMNLTRSASTRSFAHRDKTLRRNSLNGGVADRSEGSSRDEKNKELLNRVQRRRGSCGDGSNGLSKQPQRVMSMRNLFRQQSRRSVATEDTKGNTLTKNTSSFSSLGSVDVFSSDDESDDKMENYVFSVDAQDSNKSFLQLNFASVPE